MQDDADGAAAKLAHGTRSALNTATTALDEVAV